MDKVISFIFYTFILRYLSYISGNIHYIFFRKSNPLVYLFYLLNSETLLLIIIYTHRIE